MTMSYSLTSVTDGPKCTSSLNKVTLPLIENTAFPTSKFVEIWGPGLLTTQKWFKSAYIWLTYLLTLLKLTNTLPQTSLLDAKMTAVYNDFEHLHKLIAQLKW